MNRPLERLSMVIAAIAVAALVFFVFFLLGRADISTIRVPSSS